MLPFNLAEQQRKIYGTGERAVRAGDIVLDCGANVGVFTRVALDAARETRRGYRARARKPGSPAAQFRAGDRRRARDRLSKRAFGTRTTC